MDNYRPFGNGISYIPLQIFLLYTGIVSLLAFIVYGVDKSKAKANGEGGQKRRVPERTLLILAFAGGALGAAAGMLAFHHKTRKRRFCILVPVAVILWVLFLAFTVYLGIYGERIYIL